MVRTIVALLLCIAAAGAYDRVVVLEESFSES